MERPLSVLLVREMVLQNQEQEAVRTAAVDRTKCSVILRLIVREEQEMIVACRSRKRTACNYKDTLCCGFGFRKKHKRLPVRVFKLNCTMGNRYIFCSLFLPLHQSKYAIYITLSSGDFVESKSTFIFISIPTLYITCFLLNSC